MSQIEWTTPYFQRILNEQVYSYYQLHLGSGTMSLKFSSLLLLSSNYLYLLDIITFCFSLIVVALLLRRVFVAFMTMTNSYIWVGTILFRVELLIFTFFVVCDMTNGYQEETRHLVWLMVVFLGALMQFFFPLNNYGSVQILKA